MPLDGLRAWIGEVERKLGMRTRVFLVLTVIAIGGAGAGIYLALEARNDSVSESDVQALQETLEVRIGEGGGTVGGAGTAQLETELKALQAEVEQLGGEGAGTAQSKGGASGSEPSGSSESSGGKDTGGHASEGASGGATGKTAGGGAHSPRLHELLEQTKKQNEQAESEQGH